MITYNDIYEAERKERYSEQLQPLAKNFISEVVEYLKEKKEMASKDDDIFSDMIAKTKKQLENATTFLKGLMRHRRQKILNLVFVASETGISKQDFDNMLPFERSLFEEMMKNIEQSDKKFGELLNGKKEETSKNELVMFKSDIGEFMGMDGGKIGPFGKGEIANIPKEVAKILIDDGNAEILEK